MLRYNVVCAVLACFLLVTPGVLATPNEQERDQPQARMDLCTLDVCIDGSGVRFEDAVFFSTMHPEYLIIGNVATIDIDLQNLLPIPILVTVELVPTAESVCSVTSFATSSAAQSLREHEFLLWPKGTKEALHVWNDQGLINGDRISVSATVTASTPGDCAVEVHATVGETEGMVLFGRQVPEFPSVKPLPTSANLGSMIAVGAGACGSNDIAETPVGESVTLLAGEVEISSALVWEEACPDTSDTAVMTVQYYQRNDDGSGTWVDKGAARISSPGTDDAVFTHDVTPGKHTYRVKATYLGSWLDASCMLGIFAWLATLVGFSLVPEPTTKALVIMAVIAIVEGTIAIWGCRPDVLDRAEFTVTVTAKANPLQALDLELPKEPIASLEL